MTTEELFKFDLNIPEETFYLLGFFRWKDMEPRAELVKDKKNNLIVIKDEALARQVGEAFSGKYCKFGVDDGTVFCSVVLKVTRGAGKPVKDEQLTCFTAYREFSYQEAISELERLFFEKGIYEL